MMLSLFQTLISLYLTYSQKRFRTGVYFCYNVAFVGIKNLCRRMQEAVCSIDHDFELEEETVAMADAKYLEGLQSRTPSHRSLFL